MPIIEPSDGFSQAAQTLRTRAAQEADPAARDDLIRQAEKYEAIQKKAAVVFAEINQSLAHAEERRAEQKKKAQRAVWLVGLGLVALLIFMLLTLKAGSPR